MPKFDLEGDFKRIEKGLKSGLEADMSPSEIVFNRSGMHTSTWKRRLPECRMAQWVIFRVSGPGYGPWDLDAERPDGSPYPRTAIQVLQWCDDMTQLQIAAQKLKQAGMHSFFCWPTGVPFVIPAGEEDTAVIEMSDAFKAATDASSSDIPKSLANKTAFAQPNPYKEGTPFYKQLQVLLEVHRMNHAKEKYLTYKRARGEAPTAIETQNASLSPLVSRLLFSEGHLRPVLEDDRVGTVDPYATAREELRLPKPAAFSGGTSDWGLYTILADPTVLQSGDTLYAFELGRRLMYEKLTEMDGRWESIYGGGMSYKDAGRALYRVFKEDAMRRPAVIFWPPVASTHSEATTLREKACRVSRDLCVTLCGGGDRWYSADYIIIEEDDGIRKTAAENLQREGLAHLSKEEQEAVLLERDRLLEEIAERGGTYDQAVAEGRDTGLRDVGAPAAESREELERKVKEAAGAATVEERQRIMAADYKVPEQYSM